MNRRAFTLIELMIVVVIIGILSSIAIPKFTSIKEQTNEAACRCNMRSLGSAEALYYAQHSVFTNVGNLSGSGVMGNADHLECPTAGIRYLVTLALADNTYIIPCPEGAAEHGSIDDGLTSW